MARSLVKHPADRGRAPRSVITDAVNAGRIGVSPLKEGRPVKVGPDITGQLEREAAMMQASETGEVTYAKMDKQIQALTVGTAHAGTLNSKYTFLQSSNEASWNI